MRAVGGHGARGCEFGAGGGGDGRRDPKLMRLRGFLLWSVGPLVSLWERE